MIRTIRAGVAGVLLAGALVVASPAPSEAASPRCKVGTACQPRNVPALCRWHVIAVLFPDYCRRRLV